MTSPELKVQIKKYIVLLRQGEAKKLSLSPIVKYSIITICHVVFMSYIVIH